MCSRLANICVFLALGTVDEEGFLSIMAKKFETRDLAEQIKEVLDMMDEYADKLAGQSFYLTDEMLMTCTLIFLFGKR